VRPAAAIPADPLPAPVQVFANGRPVPPNQVPLEVELASTGPWRTRDALAAVLAQIQRIVVDQRIGEAL
jgi:hypothetical protein